MPNPKSYLILVSLSAFFVVIGEGRNVGDEITTEEVDVVLPM